MTTDQTHDHFTCARCGKTFKRNPNDDPQARAIARFGHPISDPVSMCSSCDQAMRVWLATPLGQQALAEWKAEQR